MIKLRGKPLFKKGIFRGELMKILLMSLILLIIPILLWNFPFINHLLGNAASWKNVPYGWIIFFACGVPYSAVGLPKQPLCFAAGVGFGFWKGLILMALICEIGAIISYLFGRYSFLARFFIQDRSDSFLQKIANFVHYSPFYAMMMLRLMPVGSAVLLSVASGMIKVPFFAFMWGSLLGSLPQEIVFVLVGDSATSDQKMTIIFAVILFIISSLLGVFLLKKYRARAL